MLPPQSPADVEPVEAELRLLDDRLRLVWNPRAFLATPGSFTAEGQPIPARYDGRWQVILLNGDPEPPIICSLTEDGSAQKAYKPVGPWIVEFLRKWDSQNVHYATAMAEAWAADDQRRTAVLAPNDAMLEDVERRAFQWSGRELFPGFTPPTA
jgi:hypothetical protein